MVVNISSVKTEALLLFCRDLINSYQADDTDIIAVNKDLLKAINVVVQDIDYYIRNMRVNRINIIVKYYNIINKMVSKYFEFDPQFNPSMLCFSMLATWFKELEHQNNSKEYIYFLIYPYGEIFDKLIVNVTDSEYKKLNIKMIQIAEDIIVRYDKKGLDGI